MNRILERWRGGLIVSCQAPAHSPLAKPEIIAAFAQIAEQNGAVGVRIDAPANISAVKRAVKIPILGIYKIASGASDVYITPTFDAAQQVAAAGADLIAVDATLRPRREPLADFVERMRAELSKTLTADIATFDEGINAAETLGFDAVFTTLSGYTNETKHQVEPDFGLVEKLAARLSVPVVCEGRLSSADDVKRAFDCGAFAVVVGNAITGIEKLVQNFVAATPLTGKTSGEFF